MASAYQTVRYGSTGSAVRQLQSALNQKGYQLSEDGIFGAKTRAAVRDYQKKNGLLLDGIAGSQTWNHLMSAAAAPSGPTESRQVLSGVSDRDGSAAGAAGEGVRGVGRRDGGSGGAAEHRGAAFRCVAVELCGAARAALQ